MLYRGNSSFIIEHMHAWCDTHNTTVLVLREPEPSSFVFPKRVKKIKHIWRCEVEGFFLFFEELKWFSKSFSLYVHGPGLPFDSSHNTVNAFGHLLIVVSYIQFIPDVTFSKFILTRFRDRFSLLYVLFAYHWNNKECLCSKFDFFFLACNNLCIANLLLLKQINDSNIEIYMHLNYNWEVHILLWKQWLVFNIQ